MILTPRVLLDTSIAQLRTLAAFLADEMGEFGQRADAANLEARACKEILLTISVLIPKLQAARYIVIEDGVMEDSVMEDGTAVGRCANCDES